MKHYLCLYCIYNNEYGTFHKVTILAKDYKMAELEVKKMLKNGSASMYEYHLYEIKVDHKPKLYETR